MSTRHCKKPLISPILPQHLTKWVSTLQWNLRIDLKFTNLSKILPTYPWKIPRTLHQQFLFGNFFLCRGLERYLPRVCGQNHWIRKYSRCILVNVKTIYTWQWKITSFNRRYIFKWLCFHCHVIFRVSIYNWNLWMFPIWRLQPSKRMPKQGSFGYHVIYIYV